MAWNGVFVRLACALAMGAFASTAAAQDAPAPKAALQALAAKVDPARLRADVERLVAFGTRHTLSDTTSPTRGIGAARRWAAEQFAADSARCGGALSIQTPGDTVTGERIPRPTLVQDVLAIQRGTTDPDRVVIISGHIDSRVSDVANATSDAPGADDDGSGTAAVLEAARVLSCERFPATIVYAVLSGEEQGLYGGKILAAYAKARGWKVEAQLNNDIVGNSHGQDGRVVADEVRVFSEGVRADETTEAARSRRLGGGEDDSPSRELSRYMQAIAQTALPGFHVRPIWRADRFRRGGDQAPLQEAGYPAVRVTEADEDYDRQHQDVRTQSGVAYGDVLSGVDFAYLARVVRLDVLTLAALAHAPAPPQKVELAGAVTADTTITWTPDPAAAGYEVWWRETSEPRWRLHQEATGSPVVLKGVNIDDYDFGVAARSADGWSSPVVFAGAVGAFAPLR